MNWLRRLLGLHVHEWGDVEAVTIGGYSYMSGRTRIVMGRRDIAVRQCQACGKTRQLIWRAPPAPSESP